MQLRLTLIVAAVLAVIILPIIGCGDPAEEAPVIAEETLEVDGEQVEAEQPPADEVEQQPEPAEDDADPEEERAPVFGPPADPSEIIPVEEDAPDAAGSRLLGAMRAVAGFFGKVIFLLALPIAIAAALLGMPGAVLVMVATLVFSAFHAWQVPPTWVLLILLGLTVIAESAEYALTFAGVKRSGATNTTGVWTMIGGLAGAILGGIISPLLASIGALAGPVGWVILSIIPPIGFALVGGFYGGYVYEMRGGKSAEEARTAGLGALFGRLAGSFTKALLVAVMVAIVLISTWGALF